MTELARYTPAATPGPVVYATDPTGGRLIAWADGLAAAHRIGSALCQTAFVPAAFRGKPEESAPSAARAVATSASTPVSRSRRFRSACSRCSR